MKRFSPRLVRLVPALVAFILLTACGTAAPAGKPAGPGVQAQPIKIGAMWDLTGPSSAGNGQVARRAVEMKVEQVNKSGGIGRPIELVIEDEKGQPTEAVAAVNKLINQDRVDALMGFTTSGSGQAALPVIEKAGVPWVAGVSASIFSTPPKKWVFQFVPTNDQFLVRTLSFLKQRSITRFAMLNDSGSYGVDAEKAAQAQMDRFGLTMVAHEKFNQGDTDLTSQLTKIKAANPQAIIVWTTDARAAAAAIKGVKQLGISATVVGSSGHANKTFTTLAGPAAEGYYVALSKTFVVDSLPDSDPQKKMLKTYIADFLAKYGADADYLKGDYPYDQISILIEAFKKAGGNDREKVRQALESFSGWQGLTGKITWNASKRSGIQAEDLVIGELRGGTWVMGAN